MPRSIGTPVRCPSCRYPNLAIDIWCERCGTPLDWKKTDAQPAETPRTSPVIQAPPAPDRPQTRTGLAPEEGTARVYCWSCGSANPMGDRFCNTCGAALSGRPGSRPETNSRRARHRRGYRLPRLTLPAIALPALTVPRWRAPRLTVPRFTMAQIRMPRLRAPQAPRLTWIVGLVIAVLLIIPLAYLLFPSHGNAAGHPLAASRRPAMTAAATLKPGSPQAVAVAAVEARTGLKYSASCRGNGACLAIAGQTMGQNAAAIAFSTAPGGTGRQCVGYVVQNNGSWQLVNADCGLPGQVTPMVGQNATVHVPGNCANVRDRAGLQGGVVTCLYNGSSVNVDGGPTFADGLIWWHTAKGWIAHTFLVSP